MRIEFDKTLFTGTLTKKMLGEVEEEVGKGLSFTYFDGNYDEFAHKYEAEVSSGVLKDKKWRQLLEVQNALKGVAKAVYHLALALIPLNGQSFKGNIFFSARDLQESFGHLIRPINDKYGLYLIQKARFHHQCYESALKAPKKSEDESKPKPPVKTAPPRQKTKTDKELNKEARQSLLAGNYDKAIKLTDRVKDNKKKNILFKLIAQFMITEKVDENTFEKTFCVINKLSGKMKNDSLNAFASKCITSDRNDFAQKVISEIDDPNIRDLVYDHLFKSCLEKKDYVNAEAVIEKLSSSEKNSHYIQLAEVYEKAGHFDSAAALIDKVSVSKTRYPHYERLAKKYSKFNEFGKAAALVSKIGLIKKRDGLYFELSQMLKTVENLPFAVELLGRMRFPDTKALYPFIEACKDNDELVRKILAVAAKPTLQKKFKSTLSTRNTLYGVSGNLSAKDKKMLYAFLDFIKESEKLRGLVEEFYSSYKTIDEPIIEHLIAYLQEDNDRQMDVIKEYLSSSLT